MREQPWAGVIAAIGDERLHEVRAGLEAANTDAFSRDAFLLSAGPGQLLRELMPPEAPADAVNSYASLLHALYCSWLENWPVVAVDASRLREVLSIPRSPDPPVFRISYLQLPERLVWAQPQPGAAHEPIDGIFVAAGATPPYALAVLGFRPDRDGFTTIEAPLSPLPSPLPPRPDGSPPFANLLPAGDFLSVADEAELAALALLAAGAARG